MISGKISSIFSTEISQTVAGFIIFHERTNHFTAGTLFWFVSGNKHVFFFLLKCGHGWKTWWKKSQFTFRELQERKTKTSHYYYFSNIILYEINLFCCVFKSRAVLLIVMVYLRNKNNTSHARAVIVGLSSFNESQTKLFHVYFEYFEICCNSHTWCLHKRAIFLRARSVVVHTLNHKWWVTALHYSWPCWFIYTHLNITFSSRHE